VSSLSWDLLNALIVIDCPRCGFSFEVQTLDALCQVWRWCPCCRVRIRLVEPSGELSGALRGIDTTLASFNRTLREMFE
jgi:hypothetical protein